MAAAPTVKTNDYAVVDAILSQHCLDCHAAPDPEAKLVLESFETLMEGGEHSAELVPGKSDDSRLVQVIEGRGVDAKGKKLIMPPGKRKKLSAAEIASIKAWIDAGAKPPAVAKPRSFELVTPKIAPKVPPHRAIKALAYAPGSKLMAVARYGEVELRSADTHAVIRVLAGHRGSVNALAFSPDGSELFAASGQPGLFGEAREWKTGDGVLAHTFLDHRDAVYAVAISPDGKTLATGSYDQKIKLWDATTGQELKTLSGHNGAIFDLAFRPDGKILASASADRTVKLWDVTTGARRDTLSQSLKDLYTLAFSPDGRRLLAGGVDNRIRVWQISEQAEETTNPILDSKFAHEGAILKIVFSADGKWLASSADDRTVKLWDAASLTERATIETQPDWSPGLAFLLDTKVLAVGRLDGSLGYYDTATGKPVPPAKPELTRIEPRGWQRGTTVKLKLTGKNLSGLTAVKFNHAGLAGKLLADAAGSDTEAWIEATAATNLARGEYELSATNPGGESSHVKLLIDDLPQVYEIEGMSASTSHAATRLPVSFWGALKKPGDRAEFAFEAKGGQTLVFDLAAKSIGSKINGILTLLGTDGVELAGNNGFDGGDPLLAWRVPASGRYRVRVNDLTFGGSPDHFFRLSVGPFAYVTGCFPLSVAANGRRPVELIGFNLPKHPQVEVKAEKPGELEVPVDPNRFRLRRPLKVLVGADPEFVEKEPNDEPAQATAIVAPCAVNGRIWAAAKGQSNDVDLFKFAARAGQTWIIETQAAQRGSLVDSRIEVLHADGRPVERVLLQAIRDSAITFRGIDSNAGGARLENWEEMDLDEFVYFQGDVAKIFRMPQGPDSEILFYSSSGRRRACFDTTATAHALDEPCYVVEPHPPGAKLTPNGLPVFPVYYTNDDDGDRKLGSDSKLEFTAPAEGAYLIRVSDSRNYSGERFAYRLVVRAAHPDFRVTLNGANPTVNRGSGTSFSVTAERIDGFEDAIKLDIGNLPPGFTVSTPLTIQAGQGSAEGTINAALDAPPPDEHAAGMIKITAAAMVGGQWVTHDVNSFGKIKPGDEPKLFVALEPNLATRPVAFTPAGPHPPLEITIAPGTSIPAWLRAKRNGYDDLITFTVENLPHGVIVDNIGLNGVLIPKDQTEREIFLTAAKWVPETDRFCFAVENQAGRQTSRPVMLHVRRPVATAATLAK
ncbi:MAG: c-type cytochrome domain-containing protein [Limisphaerales bacterium]